MVVTGETIALQSRAGPSIERMLGRAAIGARFLALFVVAGSLSVSLLMVQLSVLKVVGAYRHVLPMLERPTEQLQGMRRPLSRPWIEAFGSGARAFTIILAFCFLVWRGNRFLR